MPTKTHKTKKAAASQKSRWHYASPLGAITDDQRTKLRAARLAKKGLEDCFRDSWKIGRVPTEYEDAARKAASRGHHRFAARMWYLGSCVSLGHNRAGRYEDAAEIEYAKLAA